MWYNGPICNGCSRKIYILENPDKSDFPDILDGGVLSVECPWCYTDAKYNIAEITSFEADEDWNSGAPVRLVPSGKTRRPLTQSYKNTKVSFGPGFLERRPICAALIGRCVGLWSEVEAISARLLSIILGADTVPVVAMFITIKSSRTQGDVLTAAAATVLEPKDYNLLSAIMLIKGELEKERNNLAHGLFGGAHAINRGVAWISTSDFAEHGAKIASSSFSERESLNFIRTRTYVYEPEDLEHLAQEIEFLHGTIRDFSGYLGATHDPEWQAERYREICNRPRIHGALCRIQEGQKKTASKRSKQSHAK